ncbi:AAA family ATPase [Azohydromonas lata]|uniref:AAA family ATPase n=1 Tax=Azohydromonas lata TaxID=45677 RepID=UPI001EE40C20|nr:AAA family ATPase [Azohydromonas lata]
MDIKRFTVFRDQQLTLSPMLNVIVGENSMGKSHLLKLAYALIATSAEAGRKPSAGEPTKAVLQKAYGEKLIGVFRPEKGIGRLVTRKQGRDRCEVSAVFGNRALNTKISFATNSRSDVQVDELPSAWEQQSPLYIPTRELMTIFPNFVSVYEQHYLEFEETWRDTCLLLGGLLKRGARPADMARLIAPVEQALGGSVVLENGRFYLDMPGVGNVEMSLVAEGHRKLAMLARLIVNGVIQSQGYLFWDEPEANLNPRLIRLVASVIHQLAASGVQVFIATHSFFLLKELELLNKATPLKRCYIGLNAVQGDSSEADVQLADNMTGLTNIVALDEELAQYDRELQGS